MPKARIDISGTIEVLTALHVGRGTTRTVDTVKGKRGSNHGPPQVAEIVLDACGRPYLPGSTMKGLLRRLGETCLQPREVERLFGTAKSDGSGTAGCLLMRGAPMLSPGDTSDMPFVGGSQDLAGGVFVAARTSIDDATGTAGEGRLFFQEMVAPGAKFAFSLVVCGDSEADVRSRAKPTLAVLRKLLDGASLGKGQADGQGLIHLADAPTIELASLSANGISKRKDGKLWDESLAARRPKPREWVLDLTCEGPFIVIDSFRSDTRDKNRSASDEKVPQIAAQRCRGLPLLLGSSLMGALRARHEWLKALEATRAGREVADRDGSRLVRSRSDVAGLDASERLFGVTGYRGRLEIRALAVTSGQEIPLTSVRLDRFSGAPIDGALFTTRAFRGVSVHVRLGLCASSAKADEEEAAKLVDHITKRGLEIGHGAGKGFGWFRVVERKA